MFWRVHHSWAPEFCPENASSAPWGWALTAEDCPMCDENGQIWDDEQNDWVDCPYHGLAARAPGYSCCENPVDLVRYFEARGGCPNEMPIVVFSGNIVGWGPDHEPLVIPRIRPRPRWLTYGQVRDLVMSRERKDAPGAKP